MGEMIEADGFINNRKTESYQGIDTARYNAV
jgi:hypothetical protein